MAPPAILPDAARAGAVPPAPFRRGYIETARGQIHYVEGGIGNSGATLYCLHATAYSGRSMVRLMGELTRGRHVIALDTPGYGGSDGPPSPERFEWYAERLAEAIEGLESHPEQRVDLLGYHTGALLAADIAARHTHLVGHLVLVGVPYFDAAEAKTDWRARLVQIQPLSEDLEQFRERWDYFVKERTAGLTLEHAFECFVDELRVYPRAWHAHAALFDYDARASLPRIQAATLVVDYPGPLSVFSQRAAAAIPGAERMVAPELAQAPLQLGAARLAAITGRFLASRVGP